MKLPKAGLYRDVHAVSLYHWKCLNMRLGCASTLEFIKDTELKSASTQSRRRITLSVDDSNVDRYGKRLLIVQTGGQKNIINPFGVRMC